jgi:hypothetical protein
MESSPKSMLLAPLLVGVAAVMLCLVAPLRPQGGDALPGRLGAVTLACDGSLDLRGIAWLQLRARKGPLPYYVHWTPRGTLGSIFGAAPAILGAPAMASLTPGMVVGDRAVVRRARYASAAAVGVSALLLCIALLATMNPRRAVLLSLMVTASFAGAATLGQGLWQQTASLPTLVGALAAAAWSPRWRGGTPLAAALAVVTVWNRLPLAPLAGALALTAALPRLKEPRGWRWIVGATVLGGALLGLLLWWNARATGEALPFSRAETNLENFGSNPWSPHPARLLPGLLGLLASPGRGLLFFAPAVLLALSRVRRSLGAPTLCLFVGVLAQLLLASGYRLWWGGTNYGPRLLAELVWVTPWFLVSAPTTKIGKLLEGTALALTVLVGLLGLWRFDPRGWELQAPGTPFVSRLWQLRDSPLPALARPLPVAPLRDAPLGPFRYCWPMPLGQLGGPPIRLPSPR